MKTYVLCSSVSDEEDQERRMTHGAPLSNPNGKSCGSLGMPTARMSSHIPYCSKLGLTLVLHTLPVLFGFC